MTNATIEILASRQNVKVDTKWNGHHRVWTVKDCDGVQLFTTDDYDYLLKMLKSEDKLCVGRMA